MKYSKCNSKLNEVKVKIEEAKNKAISYQCNKSNYFEFKKESSKKVNGEIKSMLRKTFGTFKFKKTGQQMKDEIRKELYKE